MSDALLPDNCLSVINNKTKKKPMDYKWDGSISTAIPPKSIFDVVGRHTKIGDVIFRVTLMLTKNVSGYIDCRKLAAGHKSKLLCMSETKTHMHTYMHPKPFFFYRVRFN